MQQSTILNKLKLLDIRNPWRVSIVHELSNRRAASARNEALYGDVCARLKVTNSLLAKNNFKKAVSQLTKYSLLFEKVTASGSRLHLLRCVWQLDDAIIESISISTIGFSQGRKGSIQCKTILKEVRKQLASHNIKLSQKVTKTLVYYFLLKSCGWKYDEEQHLIAPKKSRRKLEKSPEQQHDLFFEQVTV